MAKAIDVMTANPFMLGSGETVEEAVRFFHDHHITTAPVITPLGEVIGQITEMELVKALVQSKSSDSKGQNKIIHYKELIEPIYFVDKDAPLSLLLRVMLQCPSHRVLVRDQSEKVIGIVSPKDLIRALTGTSPVANTLMEEIQKLQSELRELKTRMRDMSEYVKIFDSIFQSGIYCFHSVDSSGKILIANRTLHKMLGYDPGELIGKSVFDLYAPAMHDLVLTGLKKVMTTGKQEFTYSSMRTKDGKIIRVDLASGAIRDEKGHFAGTFTVSRPMDSENLLRSLYGVFDKSPPEALSIDKANGKKKKAS